MDASANWLLCRRLEALVGRVSAAQGEETEGAWRAMEQALEEAGAEEQADVALPVLERSVEAVRSLLAGWETGIVPLVDWDRAVLKRALKAYRKRLKLVRLDDESSASRNPLSKGEGSSIQGVRPPEQYPPEVWALLVAQGKLRDAGHGLLELATL